MRPVTKAFLVVIPILVSYFTGYSWFIYSYYSFYPVEDYSIVGDVGKGGSNSIGASTSLEVFVKKGYIIWGFIPIRWNVIGADLQKCHMVAISIAFLLVPLFKHIWE